MRIRKGLSEGWAWPSPQDMDRTVGGEGWGDLGGGGAGGAGALSFSHSFVCMIM